MAEYQQENTSDAHEAHNGTGFDSTSTTISAQSHSDSPLRRSLGFFFPELPIPKGSVINSAAHSYSAAAPGGAVVDIRAHAVDNGQDFIDLADVVTRTATVTTAGVEHTVGNAGFHNVTGLAAVIQEIVDRDGWAEGNNLVILWVARTSPNLGSNIYAEEHSVNRGLHLVIDFTPPAGGTPSFSGRLIGGGKSLIDRPIETILIG